MGKRIRAASATKRRPSSKLSVYHTTCSEACKKREKAQAQSSRSTACPLTAVLVFVALAPVAAALTTQSLLPQIEHHRTCGALRLRGGGPIGECYFMFCLGVIGLRLCVLLGVRAARGSRRVGKVVSGILSLSYDVNFLEQSGKTP